MRTYEYRMRPTQAQEQTLMKTLMASRKMYNTCSQNCSQCGEYVEKSLRVRTHVCPFCGSMADRDENAARNILQRGLQVLARTGPSSREREGPSSDGESPLPLKREATGL